MPLNERDNRYQPVTAGNRIVYENDFLHSKRESNKNNGFEFEEKNYCLTFVPLFERKSIRDVVQSG